MNPQEPTTEARESTLGTHVVEHDDRYGDVDVLYLNAPLDTMDREREIRARVTAFAELPPAIAPPVYKVERVDGSLRVVSAHVEGIRLSTLLDHLQSGKVSIPDDAMFELIGRVIRAVGVFHAAGHRVAHGAIGPDQIVMASHGVVLTDTVYGAALEGLHWSRERIWRAFGLALPATVSMVRFDQRNDLTQLSAVVLALLLRRPLAEEEYPAATGKLLTDVTEKLSCRQSLRTWFQQALQQHARLTFVSGVDASRAYADTIMRPAAA